MGGWTRDYRRQFPTGCLPRQTVDKCAIAYTDGHAYRDCDCNSNIDAHCNCNCNCYSYSHGDSNTDSYSDGNGHGNCSS
jgi:hypothetical protein